MNTKVEDEYLSVEMEATGGGLVVGDICWWRGSVEMHGGGRGGAEIHRREGMGDRDSGGEIHGGKRGEVVEVRDAVGEVVKCMRGWTGSVEIHGERCGDGRQMLAEREYGDPCGEEVTGTGQVVLGWDEMCRAGLC